MRRERALRERDGPVLHEACRQGNVAMVRMLLSANADITARDATGDLARNCTSNPIIRRLIDKYAQDGSGIVEIRNVSFETALVRCRAVRLDPSVVRVLLLATRYGLCELARAGQMPRIVSFLTATLIFDE